MKNATLREINFISNKARQNKIAHLATEDQTYNGREITLEGQKCLNFSSCSYMGLDTDSRIKRGAIQAIKKWGVQFSSSRSYVSPTPLPVWEELLKKMFNANIVISTSVSLGHHMVMPVLIEEGDAVIMDQQVHSSVQDAALKLRAMGISISIVRHNQLEDLEMMVKKLSGSHRKVWYLADGVYSMYGDYAPIREIIELMNRYEQLYLYIDDAHGMSWKGKNGTGYVLSKVKLHPKMVLGTSLNKAYAAGGGAFVFSSENKELLVKNCGGAYIFSGPPQIPVIGAGIASAKIHLTNEIYTRQEALSAKVGYCQQLLQKKNLPVISNPETPIFFIAAGNQNVGFNLVRRLRQDGFFVNLAIYPAVPKNCTGIRFTLTLHHHNKDIERLVEAISFHFPKVLSEENSSMEIIQRSFRRIIESGNFTVKKEKLQRVLQD